VSKDLSQRSISDTIFDLKENLTFLYPNIHSDIFKKFSSAGKSGDEGTKTSAGYILHSLKTHVQGPVHEFPSTSFGQYDMIAGGGSGGAGASGYTDESNVNVPDTMDYDIGDINITDILNITSAANFYQDHGGNPM